MLAVAILSSLDFTLNAPPLTFLLTVNVPLFGYVIVPLVALNVKFPFVFDCFPTVIVFVVSAFACSRCLWLVYGPQKCATKQAR